MTVGVDGDEDDDAAVVGLASCGTNNNDESVVLTYLCGSRNMLASCCTDRFEMRMVVFGCVSMILSVGEGGGTAGGEEKEVAGDDVGVPDATTTGSSSVNFGCRC